METGKTDLLAYLIGAKIDSRRRLVEAILGGRVAVNGVTAAALRQPVDPEKDSITLDGKAVKPGGEKHVYLLLNKPAGVLSTVRDERGRKTVLDILPEKYRRMRLYPAGRLDIDTTGLLLLTDDGQLTQRLTHPSRELQKEYYAQIKGRLTPDDMQRMSKGLRLEDGPTAPAKVAEIKSDPPYNYCVTIHEGRKRQVRRMFAVLGHQVLALKRVRMGNILLGELKEGEVREVEIQSSAFL